jgi:transposase
MTGRLHRIGALYDIERAITGKSAEIRRHVRQNHSRPLVDAFRMWCETQLLRIPGKGDLPNAMRYALNRRPAFTLWRHAQRSGATRNSIRSGFA